MRSVRALAAAAFLAALLAPGPVPAAGSPDVRAGRITLAFDLSEHPAGQEARLWVPYPVSDRYQEISGVRIGGNAAEWAVYTDREYGTPMLYARWAPDADVRRLTFSFQVRREARTADLSAPETPWDPADYRLWLRATRRASVDGQVRALAEKITAGKSSVLAKARAVYDWTCENTYRNPDARGCGVGEMSRLLADPGGKCGDISSMFVALCRAAGVPARHVLGLRQGTKPGQDITTWQHCWAEFYLPGTGWVAADPADVRKMMLKRGLGRHDPVPADLREAYWAGVEAGRVRLGVGRDLVLSPPQAGAPVDYLMYPFAQVGGATLDWLDPGRFRYRITYEPDPSVL